MKSLPTIPHLIIWLTRSIFVCVAGYYLWQMDWLALFIALQALAISFIPSVIKRTFDLFIPYRLQAGIVLFMFGTLVLGEMASFYTSFWWWDMLLHGVATIGLTILGFMVLLHSFSSKEIRGAASLSSFLAFAFAMTMAMIWEIYEFLVDVFADPDMPMQGSNADTMTDLMIGLLGALIVASLGYRYVRWRNRNVIGILLEESINGR